MRKKVYTVTNTFSVERVFLILNPGDDEIFVETKLPSPYKSHMPLRMYFSVPHNEGVDYIRKHFGSKPVEVITTRFSLPAPKKMRPES